MPDKDQELMNRGWAAMAARLDADAPPRRRVAAYWWWTGAALLLLLVGGFIWWVTTPPPPPTSPVPARLVSGGQAPNTATATTTPSPQPTPPVVPARFASGGQVTPSIMTTTTPSPQPTPPVVLTRLASGGQVTPSITVTATPSSPRTPPASTHLAGGRRARPDVLPLPARPLIQLTSPVLPGADTTDLLPFSPAPTPVVSRFGLEAGTLTTRSYPLTGAYLRADYHLPLRGRWSLLTGLGVSGRRFRSYADDTRRVADDLAAVGISSNNFFGSQSGSLAVYGTGADVSNYRLLEASGYDVLVIERNGGGVYAGRRAAVTWSAFLPVEIQYQLPSRWAFAGGFSLRHQLSRFDLRAVDTAAADLSTTGNATSGYRPWNLRVQAGVRRILNPHWALHLRFEQDVTDRFSAFVPLDRAPVEVRMGVGYRF